MRYIFLIFLFSLTAGIVKAQNIEDNLEWAKAFHKRGLSSFLVETDNSNNIFLSATYLGCPICFVEWQTDTLISGGNNSYNMFICKLDPDGNLLWFDTFGSSNDEFLLGFQVDNDDNPILYMSNGIDINYSGETIEAGQNLVKFDNDGDLLLTAHLEGAFHDPNGNGTFGQQKRQFSVSCNNDLVVMGMIWGALNVGDQTIVSDAFTNFFIAQFTSAGELDWVNYYEHSDWIQANSVDASFNQEIIISGGFALEDLDLDGTILEWDESGSGSENIFLMKLNSEGELVWAKNYFSNLLGVNNTVDREGNSIVLGQFLGYSVYETDTLTTNGKPSDLALFKVDSEGEYLWGRTIGNENSNGFGHVLTNDSSQIYFSGDIAIQNDEFMSKYTPDGEELWTYEPAGSGNRLGRDLAFDKNGSLIETGFFNGEFFIGNDTLGNGDSQWNNFILKFADQTKVGVDLECNDFVSVEAITDESEDHIQVFPNPSNGTFNVGFGAAINLKNSRITLYNSTGKLLIDRYLTSQELNDGQCLLNLEHEPGGVYFLNCINAHEIQSIRVVKN